MTRMKRDATPTFTFTPKPVSSPSQPPRTYSIWKRMQDVWTTWQRGQRVRSKLRGLLWREWTRPFGTLMSGSEWLGEVSRRDCYVRRCAIRLCDRAGLPRELARAPRARVCGKRAYATPPTLPGPTALVAACPVGKKSREPE